jgi:hypothetical protein
MPPNGETISTLTCIGVGMDPDEWSTDERDTPNEEIAQMLTGTPSQMAFFACGTCGGVRPFGLNDDKDRISLWDGCWKQDCTGETALHRVSGWTKLDNDTNGL